MMVTMDRAGRVVIPKEIRDRLSLAPDVAIELVTDGDSIRLTPVRASARAVIEVDGWPVIERGPILITDADVQVWRDADQA